MNMERTFVQLTEEVPDLSFPEVRRWKAAHPGQQAIACFPVYAPLEIIAALDLLPVGLFGAGDRLDLQYADASFGSFICSIVKTTLEMGLTGHFDLFDGFLFSSICDSARNLCYVLKRRLPDRYCEFLHLPHNPSSPAGVDFLASEYRRLIADLEALSGRRWDDDRLRAEIGEYNQNRRLIRRLYDLRAERPQQVRAQELYLLVRAGATLPVAAHNRLLNEALDELPKRAAKPRDSVRVVVEGSFCEQPPLELIRLMEEAGCYVVDDDFGLGRRWFEADVPESGDPVRALAESYLERSVYSSVRHDARKPRVEGLMEKVRRSRADAVIFLIAKFCEPAYFDYVLFKRQVEAAGIPHLLLEFEEKLFTFDRARTEVETFVESLLFA
jgi:benzoyl-CoA reductase subunit C